MNPGKNNSSSLISCNESVAPSAGLSRAIPLLPFCAFMAHYREKFYINNFYYYYYSVARLMAKSLYNLTTEKIHLNVNFMSKKETYLGKRGCMVNQINGAVRSSDM